MANYSFATNNLKSWRDNGVRLSLTQGEGLTGSESSDTYVKSIKFRLTDDNGAITLPTPTGASNDPALTAVTLAATRPNGTEILLRCNIKSADDAANGIVHCPIRASLTEFAGTVKAEIRYATSNAVIKFYGINFNVYNGVSNNAITQSDLFDALVVALSKVQSLSGDGEIIDLADSITAQTVLPVAGSTIYNHLIANYYSKTDSDNRYYQQSQVYTKAESEAAARVIADIMLKGADNDASLSLTNGELVYTTIDGTAISLGDAKTIFYTKAQVDTALAEKANSATTLAGYGITDGMKYVEVGGSDPTSVDSCTDPNTLYDVYIESDVATHANYSLICVKNTNKKVQYAFTRHGFIIYRGKSGSNAWDDWDYLPNHSQVSKDIRNAIIGGFFGIENNTEYDKSFNVHNNDVATYYAKTPYSNDNFEHSYIDEDFTTLTVSRADRPNTTTLSKPSGATKIVYRDTITQKEWSESASSTHTIKNLVPNHLYYYTFYNGSNDVLQAGRITPSGQIRMIDAGGDTFNIRDIGGWACDGGTLKYELIYRGCRLNGTDMTLSSSQVLFFKDFLGIRDEIDLRSNTDASGITDTALGIGVDYVRKPINYYQDSISTNGVTYAKLIKRIAENVSKGKISYIHCASGADRTGQLCMIIEAICGVAQTDLDRDYELTSFASEINGSGRLSSRRRNYNVSGNWKSFISTIMELDGTNLKDKVIKYLIRNGVTIEEINMLRDGLIDGEPAKIAAPYGTATITKTLTNVILDNQDATTNLYQPYTTNVFVNSSCTLQSLTVTMGGTDITNSALDNGVISIPIVTGNIVITGSAKSVQSHIKTYTLPTSSWSNGAQTVTITGYNLTANTRVDTEISPTANAQLIADDCAGIYVEQDVVNGEVVLTAKYIGNKPTANITVQFTLTETVSLDSE